jgi:hypothetical protein
MQRLLAAVLIWAAMVSCALAQSSGFNPAYPPRATAVAAVSSGADTTTASASIPAAPGQTSYVCGFTVSGLGATAGTNVTVTVGPLATAGSNFSYPYVFAAGATLLNTMLAVSYLPCIPANAQNTAITVTVPGAAGNTSTNINVQGYQFPNP